MLSAVSQRARRGPVYLVFITKPFTETPIRIKPLSAHTDHRTQPVSACVCVSVGVCLVYVRKTVRWGLVGITCTCILYTVRASLCACVHIIWPRWISSERVYAGVCVSHYDCACVYKVHVCLTSWGDRKTEEKRRQSENDVNARKKRKEMKTFTLDCFSPTFMYFSHLCLQIKHLIKQFGFVRPPMEGVSAELSHLCSFLGQSSKIWSGVWDPITDTMYCIYCLYCYDNPASNYADPAH